MLKARQQVSFTLERLDSLGHLLRAQAALLHLLDSHEPVTKESISRFIDCSKAANTYPLKNTIALLEQVILSKRSSSRAYRKATRVSLQELPTGEAKSCLCRIVRATPGAVNMSRSNHVCYSYQRYLGRENLKLVLHMFILYTTVSSIHLNFSASATSHRINRIA